jgi:bifunctional non-homologous end joining protein LigD
LLTHRINSQLRSGRRPQGQRTGAALQPAGPGSNLTERFASLAEAIAKLRSRSCIIDGEAVAVGPDGIPSFDRLRYRRRDSSVVLFAFDLIELNGDDLRSLSTL